MRISLIFFNIILLFTIQGFYAQEHQRYNSASEKELDSLVKEYEDLFEEMNAMQEKFLQYRLSQSNGAWGEFLHEKTDFSGNESGGDKINFDYFPDLGINWYSDTRYNFQPGFSDNEQFMYRTRFSTGLDWDLIGEGSFLKNKKKKGLLEKEIQLDKLTNTIKNENLEFDKKIILVEKVFDWHRLQILNDYVKFLKQRADFVQELNAKGLVNTSAFIEAENAWKKATNRIRLAEISLSSEGSADLEKYKGLAFDDMELPDWKLVMDSGLPETEKEKHELTKEIVEMETRSARQIRLRLNMRYNYYQLYNYTDRGYGSLGASLSVPLRFNNVEKQKQDYKLEQYQEEFEYQEEKLKNRLKQGYKSFYQLKNKKLELLNDIEYSREYIENELEVYKEDVGSFNPSKYIQEGINLTETKLELLEVQERLLVLWLGFIEDSGIDNPLEIAISEEGPVFNYRVSYLWSADFKKYSNDDLIKKLEKNKIDELYLSPGKEVAKAGELIKLADAHAIKITRLLGENSFAAKDNGEKALLTKLETIRKNGFKSIDLDIEPQQFDDYKQERETYTRRMNKLYARAADWGKANGVKISVSVPMNLPLETAALLADKDVVVNIMAYENTDQEKLLKRTAELRESLNNNFIWVIRLSDFSTEKEFESAEKVLKNGNVENIGYYKLTDIKEN